METECITSKLVESKEKKDHMIIPRDSMKRWKSLRKCKVYNEGIQTNNNMTITSYINILNVLVKR